MYRNQEQFLNQRMEKAGEATLSPLEQMALALPEAAGACPLDIKVY